MNPPAARGLLLANGVSVAVHAMPGRAGAAAAIAWRAGSRAERAGESGFAHLAEHLLFPDDPHELAAFDAMGGQLNAWSGREHTLFHLHVPVAELPDALARLTARLARGADLVAAGSFAREREAIRHEGLAEGGSALELALARCLGIAAPAPVDALSADATPAGLQRFLARELRGPALRVGVAGDVDPGEVAIACTPLARLPADASATPGHAWHWHGGVHEHLADGGPPGLLWLLPVPPAGSAATGALRLAERALCGGLAAPLFRELRARGLAYGVHSTIETWSDGGYWALQVVCPPTMVAAVAALVEATLERTAALGIENERFAAARAALSGEARLARDDPAALAERLALGTNGEDAFTEEPAAVRVALAEAWAQHARFVTGKTPEPALRALP